MMFTAFVAKPHVELLFAWLLSLQLDIVRVRLLSGEVLVTKYAPIIDIVYIIFISEIKGNKYIYTRTTSIM